MKFERPEGLSFEGSCIASHARPPATANANYTTCHMQSIRHIELTPATSDERVCWLGDSRQGGLVRRRPPKDQVSRIMILLIVRNPRQMGGALIYGKSSETCAGASINQWSYFGRSCLLQAAIITPAGAFAAIEQRRSLGPAGWEFSEMTG